MLALCMNGMMRHNDYLLMFFSRIIQFVIAENRIRLRINVVAARAAKLTISSKLLRQAEIVDPGSGR